MKSKMEYTFFYGAVIALIAGLVIYIVYKINNKKVPKYRYKKTLNQPIVDDRGEHHDMFSSWTLSGKEQCIGNKNMIRLALYPLDDEIAIKNFEKKKIEEADMCFPLVIEKKYFILVRPAIPGVCVAKYALLSPETENKELHELYDKLYRTEGRYKSLESEYLSLLYSYGNREHDTMTFKKIAALKSVTESNRPAVTIEQDMSKSGKK